MSNNNVHPIFQPILDSVFPPQKKLEDMTVDELKATQREWYETALKTGKIEACRTVGLYLGTRLNASWGPKYQMDKDDLSIYIDDYGGYMTAKFKGKAVMSTHQNDRLYIPGEWELQLSDLLPLAQKEAEASRLRRQEKEREELLKKLS